MKNFLYITALIIFTTGCANLNNSLTPNVEVTKDPFDSTLSISQSPVSASGISEDWHTLGFSWSESSPKVVYLTVGTQGIDNVSGVHFNVDNKIIKSTQNASQNTKYGNFSTRRFYIPISDFLVIANGKLTKMKVFHIDTYTVSSFGEKAGMRTITPKFKPFVDLLKQHAKI